MNSRRRFLKACTLASLVPLVGCRTTRSVDQPGRPQGATAVDLSFAERSLAGAGVDELAAHPAVAALVRHQSMTGNPHPESRKIVARILERLPDASSTTVVLDAWRAQAPALSSAMAAAAAYLPSGSPAPQHLYAVTGYDIGVAAPPDVVLNAGHERFLADPTEGIFYACHEAHHVGFLHHRVFPDVTALGEPGVLAEVVDFITQMEGTAVHAVRPLREQAGAMAADPDYSVYLSEEKAAEVTAAWTALRARCGTTEPDAGGVIGEVMDAMTSGGRLAYMYGAVVCERIEKAYGRAALVASILNPTAFYASCNQEHQDGLPHPGDEKGE